MVTLVTGNNIDQSEHLMKIKQVFKVKKSKVKNFNGIIKYSYRYSVLASTNNN